MVCKEFPVFPESRYQGASSKLLADMGTSVHCATVISGCVAASSITFGASQNTALSTSRPHRLASTVVREDEPVLVAAAKSGGAGGFGGVVYSHERQNFR